MASGSNISEDINDKLVGGMSFKINGANITVGKEDETITMNDVVKSINSAKADNGGDALNIRASYDPVLVDFSYKLQILGKMLK